MPPRPVPRATPPPAAGTAAAGHAKPAQPLKSMTGHGRGTGTAAGVRVSAELAGLNRKNLDISCNLPRELAFFEAAARERIAAAIHRGRVTLSMAVEHAPPPEPARLLNVPLAKAYLDAIRSLRRALGLAGEPSVTDLLALPGVAAGSALSPARDPLAAASESALAAALAAFTTMRRREGAALARQLGAGAAAIARRLKPIIRLNTAAIAARESALRRKAAELASLLPPASPGAGEALIRELLQTAGRADIAEETARIESHLAQFQAALKTGGPVGRQLDFLTQELGRELHTLGAKTASPEASRLVIECKLEAERLREQVQNIE